MLLPSAFPFVLSAQSKHLRRKGACGRVRLETHLEMRTDMHKVVVERPRWNPGPGKQHRRANLSDELLPRYEGIRRPHTNRKCFTDLLGPLKRWLHAQLGRPWNDVYSEACAVITADSVVRAHVRTHLLEYVLRHTFLHEGRVCVIVHSRAGGITPVERVRSKRIRYYLHPKSHRLLEIPRRRIQTSHTPSPTETVRWLDETTLLRVLHGCWFECRMEEFPRRTVKGDSPWRFDWAERRMICRANAHDLYGRAVYCIRKRQLSRGELKEHGVSNARGDNP